MFSKEGGVFIMAYNWDHQLLKELKKNPVAKNDLQYLYASIWDIFKISDCERYSKKQVLIQDMQYLSNYPFCESYLDKMDFFPEIDFKDERFENHFSEDDIFDLVHEFYEQMPPLIYNIFIRQFNQRHSHFNFSNSKLKTFYTGHSYISPSTGDCFIKVQRTGKISDAVVTAHEYGHVIDYYIHPYITRPECYTTTAEVTSIFMELLAMDFWQSYEEFKRDIQIEKEKFYSCLLESGNTLRDKFMIFKESNYFFNDTTYGDFAFDTFFKILRHSLELSRKELNMILKNPASCIMPYTLSSLIALELYHIYQTDPDFAFYLYKKFITIRANTALELDQKINELGIHPSTHTDTFIRKLGINKTN